MTYEPRPIDTARVTLTLDIDALTEKLAAHAHDVWARQRLLDGWTLGARRDDALKQHPCLIPYDQLPDSEKQYDRNASLETLKAILALGYTIGPPGEPSPAPVLADEAALRRELDEAGTALGALLKLEQDLGTLRKTGASLPEIDRALGERLLRMGEPVLAYDVVNESLKIAPEGRQDQRLRQLQALALARIGDTETANAILKTLSLEPCDNPALKEETLSLLARTHKDLGIRRMNSDPARARADWKQAFDLYYSAYEQSQGYYPGINAATLALLLDDRATASRLAGEVAARCLDDWRRLEEQGHGGDDYWLAATIGEAELILGRPEQAQPWYRRAREIGIRTRRFGDLASTFNQADRLLLPQLKPPRTALSELFPMPRVAVFTGHMIDQPGRARPRFPRALEGEVKDAIARWLRDTGTLIGYASAACGSDILFLEAILELGGEAHVILPYRRDLFREDSVDVAGPEWAERFDRVLERAKVGEVSRQRLGVGGMSYEYANNVLHGLARTHADQLGAELLHLAVWDGRPGDGPGGTASAIARWETQGYDVRVIDVSALQPRPSAPSEPPEPAPAPVLLADPNAPRAEILAFFFGDVVGFSQLEETELLPFKDHFLGLAAALIDELPEPDRPLKRNTWGDAVYLVFTDVRVAGRFALDLRDRISAMKWAEKGLPANLTMRIGLHAGPAFRCIDPVTQRPRFLGTHISHAARIEPKTPPGQVYSSEAFAALAAEAGAHDFVCRYVGQVPLAKDYGVFPTYHVQRRS